MMQLNEKRRWRTVSLVVGVFVGGYKGRARGSMGGGLYG